MSLLESLANYLQSKGLSEGLGVDTFLDFIPEEPANVLVLTEYNGQPPSPYDAITQRSVQILTRATSAKEARERSLAIYRVLLEHSENMRIDLSEDAWVQLYIRVSPFKLELDSNDWSSYAFNVGITTTILE